MKVQLLSLLSLAVLSACTVGPDFHSPVTPMPKQWANAINTQESASYQPNWWKTFNDPLLDQLIKEAVTANLDLEQATYRIRDARTQVTVANAAGLPMLTSKGNISRRSNNISTGGAGTGSSSSAGGGFGIGNQIINIFQTGFDAQWELDIFGGIRRSVEAADATLNAEIENRHDLQVTLVGEVARLYIQLRNNQQLLLTTQKNLTAQRDTLELTKVRTNAGLASDLEVNQQAALLATTESQLPAYTTNIKQAIHAISILLGKEPSALYGRLDAVKPLPIAKPAINNLPSDLLRRRPDIRKTERQLAAANAQVGVATAELYPKFNLAAFLGIQNTNISDLSMIGKSWSTAASISLPIFNWGKLQANIQSKNAQKQQIFLSYRATVLTAMREVEDALVAYQQEGHKQQALQQALQAQETTLQLANERYQKGLTPFLDVLVSERNLLDVQSNVITSQAQASEHLIALYKALGGGWESL